MYNEIRLTHQYGESKSEHKFEGQIVFPMDLVLILYSN